MSRVKPEKGTEGEQRVCQWWDAGNNGEPIVVFEDGSPAPFSAWEHPRSPIVKRGRIVGWKHDYPMSADWNSRYHSWDEGWYPVEDGR